MMSSPLRVDSALHNPAILTPAEWRQADLRIDERLLVQEAVDVSEKYQSEVHRAVLPCPGGVSLSTNHPC
jgi:hypothetical protein